MTTQVPYRQSCRSISIRTSLERPFLSTWWLILCTVMTLHWSIRTPIRWLKIATKWELANVEEASKPLLTTAKKVKLAQNAKVKAPKQWHHQRQQMTRSQMPHDSASSLMASNLSLLCIKASLTTSIAAWLAIRPTYSQEGHHMKSYAPWSIVCRNCHLRTQRKPWKNTMPCAKLSTIKKHSSNSSKMTSNTKPRS